MPNQPGSAPLTPRETECLRLLAVGESAKRLAHALGISPKTVEFHLTSARRKLGARTATHAVAIAMAHGWLGVVSIPA